MDSSPTTGPPVPPRPPVVGLRSKETTTPTSSLYELHRINLIRSNLGRIGDEAIRGPIEGRTAAPLTKVNLTRDTTDVSFPLGAQTRCIDNTGRIKLHTWPASASHLVTT